MTTAPAVDDGAQSPGRFRLGFFHEAEDDSMERLAGGGVEDAGEKFGTLFILGEEGLEAAAVGVL